MMSKTGLSAWMGLGRAAALTLALLSPVAAQAQFSDNYNFLKAVKDADGQKVTDLLQKPGSTVVNSRDVTSGETALHIIIARRDATWLAFMLAKGANPNLADNEGNTPLMKAVQGRFEEGARTLIARGAQVDQAQRGARDGGATAQLPGYGCVFRGKYHRAAGRECRGQNQPGADVRQ